MPVIIWLAALPEGIAEEAQALSKKRKQLFSVDKQVESLSEAIVWGFAWPQKDARYWSRMHDMVKTFRL